jgi:hypothetical protein
VSDARCRGTLRLSKGVWLFRPDAVDVLLRVEPTPPPSTEGFLSRPVEAILSVRGEATVTDGAARIEPRTGVPQRVVGRVLAVADDSLVVDAGIPLVVVVAGGGGARATVGDVVEVDVDVDAGVGCALAD